MEPKDVRSRFNRQAHSLLVGLGFWKVTTLLLGSNDTSWQVSSALRPDRGSAAASWDRCAFVCVFPNGGRQQQLPLILSEPPRLRLDRSHGIEGGVGGRRKFWSGPGEVCSLPSQEKGFKSKTAPRLCAHARCLRGICLGKQPLPSLAAVS